jgi:hypothetical protein
MIAGSVIANNTTDGYDVHRPYQEVIDTSKHVCDCAPGKE